MAENANTPPHNVDTPAAEDSEAPDDNEQELTGPSLDFELVEDLSRQNQLGKPPPPPVKPKHYRPNERQLLQEGKRAGAEIYARLERVEFGTFKGETACLVVVQVDFAPKSGSFFRFRSAEVEVRFEEEERIRKENEDEDEVDEDEDDEDDEDGLLVLNHDPKLIRGHIQTIAETLGITVAPNIAASAITVGGVSADWRVSSSQEAQHLVHGRLLGILPRGVKWTINENEASKSGLYQQPIFAVIVRYREKRGFVMTLTMKATTFAWLAVKGKEGSRIKFTGGKERQGKAGRPHKMSGLVGGSIASGGKTWTAGKDSEPSQQLLEELDLESLTGMKATLLSEQGPGGAAFMPMMQR